MLIENHLQIKKIQKEPSSAGEVAKKPLEIKKEYFSE
jgi:hypothetical protein